MNVRHIFHTFDIFSYSVLNARGYNKLDDKRRDTTRRLPDTQECHKCNERQLPFVRCSLSCCRGLKNRNNHKLAARVGGRSTTRRSYRNKSPVVKIILLPALTWIAKNAIRYREKERERERNLRKREEQKHVVRFVTSHVCAAQINESIEHDCFSLTW